VKFSELNKMHGETVKRASKLCISVQDISQCCLH